MRVPENPDTVRMPVVAIYGPAGETLKTVPLYSQIRSDRGMNGYKVGTDERCDAVITDKYVEGSEQQLSIVIRDDGKVFISPDQPGIILKKTPESPDDDVTSEILLREEILSPTDTVTVSLPESETITFGVVFRNDIHKDFIIEYLKTRIKSLLEKRTQIILEEQNPSSPRLHQLDLQIFEAYFALSEFSGKKNSEQDILGIIASTRKPFDEQIEAAKAEKIHERKTLIGATVAATAEKDFFAEQAELANRRAKLTQEKAAEASRKKSERDNLISLRTSLEGLRAFHIGDHESPETTPVHYKAPVLIRDGDGQMIPFIIDDLYLGTHKAATYEAEAPSARNRELLKARLRPRDVDAIARMDRKTGRVLVTVISSNKVALVGEDGTEYVPSGITIDLEKELQGGNKLRIANQYYRLEKDHGFSPEAYRLEASGMIEELMERILDIERTFASADLQDPDNDDYKAYRDIILILSRLPEGDAKKEQIENCKKRLAEIFISLWKRVREWESKPPESDAKVFPTLLLLLTIANKKGSLVNPQSLRADERDANPVNYDHVRAQALNRVLAYIDYGRNTYGKRKPGQFARWFSKKETQQTYSKEKTVADIGVLEIARFMEMTYEGDPLVTEEDLGQISDEKVDKAYLIKIQKVRAIRTSVDNLKKSKGNILTLMREALAEAEEAKMSDAYGPEEIAIININNTYNIKPEDKIEDYINNIIREHANQIYRGLIKKWEELNPETAGPDQLAKLDTYLLQLNQFLESGRVHIGHLVRTVMESRATSVMHSRLKEIERGIKEIRAASEKREAEKQTRAELSAEVNKKHSAKMEKQRQVLPRLIASLEQAESDQNIVVLSDLLKKDYITLMQDEEVAQQMTTYEQHLEATSAASGPVMVKWAELRARWSNQVLKVARACAERAVKEKENTLLTLVLIKKAVTAGIFTFKDIGYSEKEMAWSIIREKFKAYQTAVMAKEPADYTYLDEPFFPEVKDPEFRKKLEEMRSGLTSAKLKAIMEIIKKNENTWFYKTIIKRVVAKDPNSLGHLSSDEYGEISAILN